MRHLPWLLAAAALIAAPAQAATYTFRGTLDAGPLAGATFTGSFSVDDSLVTGAAFEPIALTALTLDFEGQAFTLTPGASADYAAGTFLGLSYGTTGPGYTLTMSSGSVDLSDAFLHVQPLTGVESSGGYTVSAIPEPGPAALMLAGLAGVGLAGARLGGRRRLHGSRRTGAQ